MRKVFEIGLNVDQYLSAAQNLQKEIVRLNNSQKSMKGTTMETSKAYVANSASLKTLRNDYQNLNKQIIETNTQNKINKQLTDEVTASLSKEAQTINEANQQITRLNKLKKSLNVNNKDEKKLLDDINTKIDQNTKFVKENSSSVEKQKMNIGNYAGAVSQLNPVMGSMLRNLMMIKEALVAQRLAMSASTAATGLGSKALRIFKLALIATGIGAIVVVLGSLILYLTKSQTAMDAVSRVMAGVGAAVDVIVDRFIAVGKVLSNIFNQSFMETINGVTESFEGMGDEMQRDIELAVELERATQELRDTEIAQIEIQAQRRLMIERNRLAAKDEQKSYSERISFLKTAQALEVANMNEQVANAKTRANNAQKEYDRANSVAKDLKGLNELKAESIQLETQSLKLQRTIESELQSLEKRRITEATKAEKAKQDRITKEDDAKIEREQKEIDRMIAFEQRKLDLEFALDLKRETDKEQKEILKTEQDFIKQQNALQNMEFKAKEEEALLILMEEEKRLALQDITDKYDESDKAKQKKAADAEIAAKKKLAQAIMQGKMDDLNANEEIAKNLSSIASDVFGESKIAASAMALVDTYFTASKAYQSQFMPISDITSPVRGALAAAAAIISGLKTVQNINKVKLAEGGLLSGKSHAQGGIMIEAEDGESVINKRSTQMFKPILSMMNQAGGGVKFASGGVVGGMDMPIDSLLSNTIDITSQLSNIRVLNVASETADVLEDVVLVENVANI